MGTRLLLFFLLSAISYVSAELEIVNQWSLLSYEIPYGFPTHKDYNPENTVSTGFEVGWERVFITTPRLWAGNPATLAWIPRNKGDYASGSVSPPLQAYPSWDLRYLYTGIRSITFPPEVLRLNTLLTNIILDDLNEDAAGGYGNCDNIFAYMSDSTNPGILVYDSRNDRAWRLSHPAMFPDPDFGTYSVAGESFTLMDGIIGLALSPPGTSTRRVYFEAFASNRIYTIPVSALRAGPNQGDDADLPVSLLGTKSSQAAPLAVDNRDGSLIFSPVSETAIASWVPGSTEHTLPRYSPELLQFPLDIRSVDRDSGTIWVITTRFQKFFKKTVSNKEINIRLMRITKPIDEVVRSLSNNSLLLKK
ncbi:protein yellow [Diaphorina citri]|uniref:Protein yellow n=1 Tax=Diaphorina citri TaxID=121845 RepID=A0A3Q0J4Q6_DIACI|nr:protein yellow [Diaphorina citri]